MFIRESEAVASMMSRRAGTRSVPWKRVVCVLLFASSLRAAEVTRAGRWELHSSFWMSLHQTLMHDVVAKPARDLARLSAEERATWDGAVEAYRQARGRGSITFSRPMLELQDALTQVADDAVKMDVPGPLADAMRKAAPVYRAHWWRADDAANRFYAAYAAAMLRELGEDLIRAHEAVYRTSYPESIRVDITPYAEPFGAYTISSDYGRPIATVSSRESGYEGVRALEAIVHESSHAVVFPSSGTVGSAINAAAKKRGIKPPRDLWHALLFATSSELTRRALESRGVSNYVPFSVDLLTRAWPQYRAPIETHWLPYLAGKGALDEAIDAVVEAIAPRK